MRFICKNHRQQVLASPATAIEHWDSWMQQASMHLVVKDWPQATRYLGCSLDVSGWLLDQPELIHTGSRQTYLDRFVMSGHKLAECLGRQGECALELHYLLAVHIELMSRMRSGGHQQWQFIPCIETSLIKIKLYCQQYGKFKGFDDCVSDTADCVKRCLH